MRKIPLIMAFLVLMGCASPKDPPVSSGPKASEKLSSMLGEAVLHSKHHPPCNSIIPIEWPAGRSVPESRASRSRFKIFFFPLTRTPTGPQLHTPGGSATLDIETGRPVECALIPGGWKELSRRRWGNSVEGLSASQFDELGDKLSDRTEKISVLYAANRALNAEEAGAAKEFLELFEMGSEPDLLPYYYRLNPAFWEWLREVVGRSIPATPPH